MQDINYKPFTLIFDVTNNYAPIKIGMDAKDHIITNNLEIPNTLTMKPPSDETNTTLHTYTSETSALDIRQRILV